MLPARVTIEISVSDLAPGSTVTIRVESTPRALASWTADEDGQARGVVTVPVDLPAGRHALVAKGYDTDYSGVERSQALTVSAPRPLWFWPSVAVAVVALAGAVALAVVAARSRRVS